MTHRLTVRAPTRCWFRCPCGCGFTSRPWGLLDVLTAHEAGAVFQSGQHDFDSAQASFAAFNGEALLAVMQGGGE